MPKTIISPSAAETKILNFNRVEAFVYTTGSTVNVWHEPPTTTQIRTEIDANSTKLASILEDTGTTIPNQISGISGGGATKEEIRIEMDNNSTKLQEIKDAAEQAEINTY